MSCSEHRGNSYCNDGFEILWLEHPYTYVDKQEDGLYYVETRSDEPSAVRKSLQPPLVREVLLIYNRPWLRTKVADLRLNAV